MSDLTFPDSVLPVGDIVMPQVCSLADIKNIIDQYGIAIIIQLRTEAEVTRGSLNSLKKRGTPDTISCRAYPIDYSPSEYQLEKAGLRLNTEVMIHTAMLDYINAGVDFSDIAIEIKRSTVILESNRYEIGSKNKIGQVQDSWLYIVLGLNKL